MAFPQLSWRNHARYSPPVFALAQGQPEEWQTLLKLAAIVQGVYKRALDGNASSTDPTAATEALPQLIAHALDFAAQAEASPQ